LSILFTVNNYSGAYRNHAIFAKPIVNAVDSDGVGYSTYQTRNQEETFGGTELEDGVK